MKVGVIGSTGLVGSRIIELLSNSYSFTEFNASTGTDITNPDTLGAFANDPEIELVILLAAKTDVDGCEQDRALGEEGAAWKINVQGVQNVAQVCKDTGKKLLYVSTDFVFDGAKLEGEEYNENDIPNPVNWYGYTKLKGEQGVQESGAAYAIVRLAYPYRSNFEKKKDFMRAIKSRLESGQQVTAVSDHIFTPTFIDDFVSSIDAIITQNVSGIYHVVGNEYKTPYEAALKIAEVFELDASLISPTTRAEYFAQKANRPFNLALNNDKIRALGVRLKSFEEGLKEIKNQITNSK